MSEQCQQQQLLQASRRDDITRRSSPQLQTITGSISSAAGQSSSSRMRVINHNWSAMKQRLHLQSVAGDMIRQCETSSGSRHKDTDQCL